MNEALFYNIIISILIIALAFSFMLMYLMNVRIKQLQRELKEIRNLIAITDEELTRLAKDIEDFKKIKI